MTDKESRRQQGPPDECVCKREKEKKEKDCANRMQLKTNVAVTDASNKYGGPHLFAEEISYIEFRIFNKVEMECHNNARRFG